VIFQPELRRGLIRLGEARLLRTRPKADAGTIDPIVAASAYLAKQRMGAIIVIEQDVGLRGMVEGGTDLDAILSTPLLQSIFFPGAALHDLAVVVQGAKIKAAGVQLPLADPGDMPDPSLGSRHRAAVGLTKECDALAVVVSEETGAMRIAQRGRLSRPYSAIELAEQLRARLGVLDAQAEDTDDVDDEPPTDDADLSGDSPDEPLRERRGTQRGEAGEKGAKP
jgi:diadenylate cyclase